MRRSQTRRSAAERMLPNVAHCDAQHFHTLHKTKNELRAFVATTGITFCPRIVAIVESITSACSSSPARNAARRAVRYMTDKARSRLSSSWPAIRRKRRAGDKRLCGSARQLRVKLQRRRRVLTRRPTPPSASTRCELIRRQTSDIGHKAL